MGCQHTYGALSTGGGFALLTTFQPSYEETLHEPRWSMQQRSPKTYADRNAFFSCWTFGANISMGGTGGGTNGDPVVGPGRVIGSIDFEPHSYDAPGAQSYKWLLGRCVDASDVAVDSATVTAFVTSTNVVTGSVVCKADGGFAVPTTNPSVNHYLVGYKAGTTVGTTVNTLVPTDLDGT